MKRFLLVFVFILPYICSCSSIETEETNGVPRNLIGTWVAVKVEDFSDWKKKYEEIFHGEEYTIVFDEYTYTEYEDGEMEWRSAYTYEKKNKRIVPSLGKVMVVNKLSSSELVLIYGDMGGDIGYEQGDFSRVSFIKLR